MSNRVDRVTIVGGGTAGWITACFLARALNQSRDGRPVDITVIESPRVPTVGVGESTLPIMPALLSALDVNETEFVRRCNVSFKCAGRFVNWNVDHRGRPVSFINPFETPAYIRGFHPAFYYNRFGPLRAGQSFVDTVLPTENLIDTCKGPRFTDMGDYDYVVGYSYHLDARLFADYLRELALQRGVRHVRDDVEEVLQDERGYVRALRLKEQGEHPVELVIDCTGFRGMIINQVLGEPFESYIPYLLCDRAAAVQIPHDSDHPRIVPCTTATGTDAGWFWNVPLYSRVGTGYVFSSAFLSEDEAAAQLKAMLGERIGDAEPFVVKMRIGVTRRSWVKNCVAIGLSAGFVEPLEATAIGMIDKAARWLVTYFPDKDFNPALRRQFNKLMRNVQEESRDFIQLHYIRSNREDTPFWRAAREEVTVSESLQEKMELWSAALPTEDSTLGQQMFSWTNYLYVMFGKNLLDGVSAGIEDSLARPDWVHYNKQVEAAKQQVLQRLPDHYDLLTRIRGAAGDGFKSPFAARTAATPEMLLHR